MRPFLGVFALALLITSAAQATIAGPSFRGNGGKTLPPFSVAVPSTMRWIASGGVFQTFPAGTSVNGSVNSQAASGWTYLPKGRYTLQVNAIGNWTIQVVPGIVRPKLAGGWASYSGNGGLQLPPFKLPRSEQVYWTAKGGLFQIFSSGFTGINVNSQAGRGSTYATKGSQKLQVNALGAWTIRWRP